MNEAVMFRCEKWGDNTRDETRQPFLDPYRSQQPPTSKPRNWHSWAICDISYLVLSITNAECLWELVLCGSRQDEAGMACR